MTDSINKPVQLAVLASEFEKFGCPHCGGIFGNSLVTRGGSQSWRCTNCDNTSVFVADGITRSTIGFGNYFPNVTAHPRQGHPVDREKLISERVQRIECLAIADLGRWLLLGHGQSAPISKVGSHTSKSQVLPIIASKSCSNVRVTWFSYNYSFYFMGVELRREIPATLLYPISKLFGHYPLSGHVNRLVAPAITNFDMLYHNCTPVQNFGGNCGGNGLQAALALRYLEVVSKLDIEAILDICLRETNYGNIDFIDGDAIELAELGKLLSLEGVSTFTNDVTNTPGDVFEKIAIDWYGTRYGGNGGVMVTMKKGVILPMLPSPASISLDPSDTVLKDLLPHGMIKRIPIQHLEYPSVHSDRYRKLKDMCNYEPNQLYYRANPGTQSFVFHTPNVLDSVLTVFFLMNVVAPVLRALKES